GWCGGEGAAPVAAGGATVLRAAVGSEGRVVAAMSRGRPGGGSRSWAPAGAVALPAGVAAGPPAARRTSSAVMRPPSPLAATLSSATPSSRASWRTAGVAWTGAPVATPAAARAAARARAATAAAAAAAACGGDLDRDRHRADRHPLALLHVEGGDGAGARRGDLDAGLVGHDLDQRLILAHDVAGLDQPAHHLAFGHTLTDVGKLDVER